MTALSLSQLSSKGRLFGIFLFDRMPVKHEQRKITNSNATNSDATNSDDNSPDNGKHNKNDNVLRHFSLGVFCSSSHSSCIVGQ